MPEQLTIGLVAMAAGHWNNGHLFSIWLLFRQTFAIWLFVVNFIFGFSIGSSCGLTFFKCRHSTKPSTLWAMPAQHPTSLTNIS
jgi:hypothetical protein